MSIPSGPVVAQTTAPDTARTEVLSWLRVGDAVRVQMSDDRIFHGTVARLGPDALQVERGDKTYVVAPSSIEATWFKARSIGTGARVGGIVGGTVGLLYGGLFALMCSGEGDGCAMVVPVMALVGGLGGAAVGGILGSAVPRWRPTYGADAKPNQRPVRSTRGPIGLLDLRMAMGSSPDTDRGGGPFVGGGLGFYTGIGRHVAFGPDIGFQPLEADEWVGFLTGTLRVSTERDRPFVYGLASAGWHIWHVTVSHYQVVPLQQDETYGSNLSFFGGAIGVGAGLPLGARRPALVAEMRTHTNLQNLAESRDFTFVTANLGLEFAW